MMSAEMNKYARRRVKWDDRLDPVNWERLMTAVLLLLALSFDVHPVDRTVWCVEMVWVVGLWAILFFTRRMFLFSTAAYFCFFSWMVFQVVGAHYTSECVPLDWLTKSLDLARNPYNLIARFVVGWFVFPLAELFLRRGWARSPGFASFFAVASTVASAGILELYAVFDGGEAGTTFLGTQGDVWNALKNILCVTFGALCAAGFFLFRVRCSPRYWMRTMRTTARTKKHFCEIIVAVLMAVLECSMWFSGIAVAVLVLLRDGLFSGWWRGVLLATVAYMLGWRVWPTKGFLRLLLGTLGWIMMLIGIHFAVEVLFRDGLLGGWWAGVVLIFAGYKLAQHMGMIRKLKVGQKLLWMFESSAQKKKRGDAEKDSR